MSKKPHHREKYSDDDLCQKMLMAQEAEPLLSEAAVCGVLRVNREYIANRAKKSDAVNEARGICTALRQLAWERRGVEGMRDGKNFNATTFIWMTRNMLGWRDGEKDIEQEMHIERLRDEIERIKQNRAMTPEQIASVVRIARQGKQ